MAAQKYREFTISHACSMTFRIGTNCPCGGDAGHGGITTFEVQNAGGAAADWHDEEREAITIVVRGDAEAEVLARGLIRAGKALRLMLDGWAPEEAKRAAEMDLAEADRDTETGQE